MTLPPDISDKPLADDPLDRLLAETISRDLEPHRGKAAAAFRASMKVAGGGGDPLAPIPIERGRRQEKPISRREFWLWTTVPSALAACLAVAVTLAFVPMRHTNNVENPIAGTGGGTILVKAPQVEQIITNQGETSGVLVSNDRPMRVLKQQTVQQTKWVDPVDNATYTVTEPIERVNYVEIKPF